MLCFMITNLFATEVQCSQSLCEGVKEVKQSKDRELNSITKPRCALTDGIVKPYKVVFCFLFHSF